MKKFVVLLMMLMAVSARGCIFRDDAAPHDETPVVDEALAKMPEDLLAVIEYEKEHPGRERDVATGDLVLKGDGTIRCRIFLDPTQIEVITFIKPEMLVPNDQPATQLVVDYGGTPLSALDTPNSVYAIMPLIRLKDLAREEAVTEIRPARATELESIP